MSDAIVRYLYRMETARGEVVWGETKSPNAGRHDQILGVFARPSHFPVETFTASESDAGWEVLDEFREQVEMLGEDVRWFDDPITFEDRGVAEVIRGP